MDPNDRKYLPDTAALIRAAVMRLSPFEFEGPAESHGEEQDAPSLAVAGVTSGAVRVAGRLHHSVQATGLEAGEAWKVKASLNNADYAQVGADVAANGFAALPDGVYGFLRADQSAAPAALTVQYSGAGLAASIAVANGTLKLTVDAVTTAFALSNYASYTALRAALAAAGVTTTVVTANPSDPPTDLLSATIVDAKTAPSTLRRAGRAAILIGSMR